MSKVKKVFAIILSMAMILGMSLTAFAAVPSENDTATITVTDVEKGATVTAYQIVKPTYNTYGLTGYEVVSPYSIADTKNFKPTPQEIIAIAGQVSGEGISMTADESGTSYSATVGAGEYIVIISGVDIYNPIVVSASYGNSSDSATLANSSVSADSNWVLDGETVYAKSTETVIEKTVSESDVNAGDTVSYKIEGEIPSYSATYTNPVYYISDVLTNATYKTSGEPAAKIEPVVTIGGTTAVQDTDYTLAWTEGEEGFTINFLNIGDYAGKTDAERKVVITYDAVISETAISTDPATNEATVNYGNSGEEKTKADKTYTYTFEIDEQFTKVDENQEPMAGATFTLFKEDGTTVVKTCTTAIGDDGKAYIHFEGLDAGTYKLKETEAPSGYSVNDTVYTVVITAEYNEDGTLKDGFPVITIDGEVTTVEVQNTKLSSLPSTGGIGTTIFTVGGCAIMIAAAGLFFASRRKESK